MKQNMQTLRTRAFVALRYLLSLGKSEEEIAAAFNISRYDNLLRALSVNKSHFQKKLLNGINKAYEDTPISAKSFPPRSLDEALTVPQTSRSAKIADRLSIPVDNEVQRKVKSTDSKEPVEKKIYFRFSLPMSRKHARRMLDFMVDNNNGRRLCLRGEKPVTSRLVYPDSAMQNFAFAAPFS